MRIIKKLASISTVFILAVALSFSAFSNTTEAAPTYKIEINKRTNYLYLYLPNQRKPKKYNVATGKLSTPTPVGTMKIITKFTKPPYTNAKGQVIPGEDLDKGGGKNPLGPRWLGLERYKGDEGRKYGIHGTNDDSSIGKDISNGCIRMHNWQVKKLFSQVPIGTWVWIHTGTSNGTWRGTVGAGETILPSSGKVKVTTEGGPLNVRNAPSITASTITRVSNGTILNKVGKSSAWIKVLLRKGTYGYVSAKYVRTVN